MGQLPDGAISLIETVAEAEAFQRPGDAPLAYATQTTLSVDDTAGILKVLKRRFPELPDPHKEDICYATTNRQEAVKVLGEGCELVLVVGSKNSSNSARLVEVAMRAGARDARLVDAVRTDPRANALFLDLLSGRKDPASTSARRTSIRARCLA